MLFIIVGCTYNPTTETITDPHTIPELEIVEQEENMIVLEYHSDNMERGDNPYNYLGRFLVIELDYYVTQTVQRGDVVFYKRTNDYYDWFEATVEEWLANEDIQKSLKEQGEEYEPEPVPDSIARIISLSGETIEIKNGQIYINGKRLDAFYGDITQNIRSTDSEKEYNMESITVPDGHVFVMGDLLWRSIDSTLYGPIPIDNIIGKVKGYKK